jgi:hypothetical protein
MSAHPVSAETSKSPTDPGRPPRIPPAARAGVHQSSSGSGPVRRPNMSAGPESAETVGGRADSGRPPRIPQAARAGVHQSSSGSGPVRRPNMSAGPESAETVGGRADSGRPPRIPQAARADVHRSSGGFGPVSRLNVSACPPSAGDISRPGNANRGGAAGRAEAAGGAANQRSLPPIRPTAQADDIIPGVLSTHTARADAAQTGAAQARGEPSATAQADKLQRLTMRLKVAEELAAQSRVLTDVVQSLHDAVVDATKHAGNASEAALVASEHYLAILTAIWDEQGAARVGMNAVRPMEERARNEVRRAKRERERAAREAEQASIESKLADDQLKRANEAIGAAAAEVQTRAPKTMLAVIAAWREASTRVAAHEAAARAAAGQAQEAAQAVGALLEEVLQILSLQSQTPLRRALGEEPSWRRGGSPDAAAGAA